MFTIEAQVSLFEPISLEKMDEVLLLDRMDTKYAFQAWKLPGILTSLSGSYFVLEVDGVRIQRYDSLYFDTPGNKCYLDHHNRRMNRFKIRHRRYLDSGLAYFEIKIKSNKGRIRKERRKAAGPPEEIGGKLAALLSETTGLSPDMVEPAIRIGFSRITLVNQALTERITIDTLLEFSSGTTVQGYPGVVIAELKQNRACPSHFHDTLHHAQVLPCRISKYCIAMCTMNPGIKHNNFKEKLHYLNKLNHDIR